MSRTFEVRLHGALTGILAEPDAGNITFRFVNSYLESSARPVLGQFFEDDLNRVYKGRGRDLPAFFANIVPEGHLREIIAHSAGLDPGDDLGLLSAVGNDLPGAVEIRPASLSIADSESEPADWLVGTNDRTPEEAILRFSLAGVQLKFSVLREQERLSLPAHDQRGAWIVKLDSATFPHLVENEFATMEWARGAAFDVPELHVQSAATLPASLQHYTVPGSNILVIRRYDRLGNERIHQEDFAQVVNSPPRLKYDQLTYEQVAALVRAIAGREGFFELVRRLAFVIASGNVDAHLKNWSFLYPDGVNAVLTPMYDQVSTVAWPELKPELALKLAGVKHLLQLTPDTVRRFAARADMDGGETVREFEAAIERIATAWKASGVGDIMPRPHIEALRRYWSRSTLLRRFRGALV